MAFDKLPEVEKLIHVINQFIEQQDFSNAINACTALNQSYPKHAEGWYITSRLALQLNNPAHALNLIEKSRLLEPLSIRWKLHQIHCLAATNEREKSLLLARELTKSCLDDSLICEELALFFCHYEQFEEAKNLYTNAVKFNKNSTQLYYNLGSVQRYLGELNLAIDSCDKAIALERFNADAHFLRSSLSKQSNQSNHIIELEQITHSDSIHPVAKAKIHFALAKELEDCQRYEESFESRKRGAKLYRDQLDYQATSDIAFIRQIKSVYNKELFSQNIKGSDNKETIFVLGLPRSGTTLVERIIGNHKDVFSAGELTNFTHQMVAMMENLSTNSNLSRTELVQLSSQMNFKQLGESYVQSTRPSTAARPRFIDKFPQNSLYAGIIHLALPGAKIVLLERHPLDVCYAIYKQLFTEIYQFSYDLNELADYYIAYHQLMEHWKEVLPGIIHVVRYEELVTDLKSETEKLLAHCHLSWQAECLEFHNNRQASTTASASQVREKLYSSSIGLWKNYQTQLAPLIDKLEKAGCLKNWSINPDS